MSRPMEHALNHDEFRAKMALEKVQRMTLARDLFLLAMLMLVACGVALYYDAMFIAAGLFCVFLIVHQVAFETRLQIAMIDTNGWLALLLNQHSRELQQLRIELKQEQERSIQTR